MRHSHKKYSKHITFIICLNVTLLCPRISMPKMPSSTSQCLSVNAPLRRSATTGTVSLTSSTMFFNRPTAGFAGSCFSDSCTIRQNLSSVVVDGGTCCRILGQVKKPSCVIWTFTWKQTKHCISWHKVCIFLMTMAGTSWMYISGDGCWVEQIKY